MKNIIVSFLMIAGMVVGSTAAHAAECTTYAENENSCPAETRQADQNTAAFCLEPGKCDLPASSVDRHSKTNPKDLLNSIAQVNSALGKSNAKEGAGETTSQEADK